VLASLCLSFTCCGVLLRVNLASRSALSSLWSGGWS